MDYLNLLRSIGASRCRWRTSMTSWLFIFSIILYNRFEYRLENWVMYHQIPLPLSYNTLFDDICSSFVSRCTSSRFSRLLCAHLVLRFLVSIFSGNIIEELTSPNLAVCSFVRNTQHMPSWVYGCACLAVRCLVSISVDDAVLSNATLSSSLCAVSLD